jgi:hypothetical protein
MQSIGGMGLQHGTYQSSLPANLPCVFGAFSVPFHATFTMHTHTHCCAMCLAQLTALEMQSENISCMESMFAGRNVLSRSPHVMVWYGMRALVLVIRGGGAENLQIRTLLIDPLSFFLSFLPSLVCKGRHLRKDSQEPCPF